MKASVGASLTLTLMLTASTPLMALALPHGGPGCASPSAITPSRGQPSASTAVFSLDGVELQLSTSFLPDLEFSTSDPSSAIQVATAVEREPLYREFSITAVPFGSKPPTESLPRADADSEEVYRAALRKYREGQGGDPATGAVTDLFGRQVAGLRSEVDLHIGGGGPTRLVITEWVVAAGDRIWIVRASQELETTAAIEAQSDDFLRSALDTKLTSDELDQPSTSLMAMDQGAPPLVVSSDHMIAASSVGSELPLPPWWNGECDTDYYFEETGQGAYPLGAEYRGVKACGPRPWYDDGPHAYVDFGAGVRQIEWQCPELSKRFLYLAYGIAPYPANGNEVVWNYTGDLLEKVPNCEIGRVPEPNDVLSYGSTSTYGHTSVVVASDVDIAGDGRIWVIEQNSSPTGVTTIAVDNWCVDPSYTDVSGWLHDPAEGAWEVEYYDDNQPGEQCGSSYHRGVYVFADWGEEGPGGDCPADPFSARFSREVYFAGGHYTFTLGYDGGARLKIGDKTVIDGWEIPDQPHDAYRFQEGHHDVEEGYHELTVEYRHDGGDGYLAAFWWGPGFDLAREEREDHSRWYGQYWGNQDLWGEPVVRANLGSGFLDHNWGGGGPADGLPVDHFGSRFERAVPFEAGQWRFVLSADDGVRLWIDDELVVNEWQDQVATFKAVHDLSEGNHELKLEHYENKGLAQVRLSWERVDLTTSLTGTISSPVYLTVVDSCPLTITAEVRDEAKEGDSEDRGVAIVGFHAAYDDEWYHLGDDEESPYELTWDCSSVDNQGVWLAIHVEDDQGNKVVDLGGHVYIVLEAPEHVYIPIVVKGH